MFGSRTIKIAIPERERLNLIYDKYRNEYENALKRMHRKLRKVLLKTDINFNIKFRLKSFDSYFNKVLRLRKEALTPVAINDLIGLRVIVPFLEDVDDVQDLIKENFNVAEIEYKGADNSFREFGYSSVHILVHLPQGSIENTIPYVRKTCEIQLRTILQDAWAEVEHELVYKSNISILNGSIKRKLASLNASLTLSDIIFQEIRDYQKSIAQWQERKQNHFLEKIQDVQDISILSRVETPQVAPPADPEIVLGTLKPKNELESLIFDALEAHSNDKIDLALNIYSKILRMKLNPKIRSIIYNHRGMAHFVQSEYEKAVKDFSRAIDFDPQNVKAFNNRGLSFRMLHQYDRALLDFETSLEMDPYQYETYHMRALTYFDMDDLARALDDCEKALSLKKDFAPARHLRRLVSSKLGF